MKFGSFGLMGLYTLMFLGIGSFAVGGVDQLLKLGTLNTVMMVVLWSLVLLYMALIWGVREMDELVD